MAFDQPHALSALRTSTPSRGQSLREDGHQAQEPLSDVHQGPKDLAKGKKTQEISQDEHVWTPSSGLLPITQVFAECTKRGKQRKKEFPAVILGNQCPWCLQLPHCETAPAAPHPFLSLCHSPSQKRSARLASLMPALCTLQEC